MLACLAAVILRPCLPSIAALWKPLPILLFLCSFPVGIAFRQGQVTIISLTALLCLLCRDSERPRLPRGNPACLGARQVSDRVTSRTVVSGVASMAVYCWIRKRSCRRRRSLRLPYGPSRPGSLLAVPNACKLHGYHNASAVRRHPYRNAKFIWLLLFSIRGSALGADAYPLLFASSVGLGRISASISATGAACRCACELSPFSL